MRPRLATRRAPLAAVLGLLALGEGGCGQRSPAALSQSRSRQQITLSATVPSRAPHGPAPGGIAPSAGSSTKVVLAFARAYINWTYRDVAARMTMLARASIGQAQSEMALTAARTRLDPTLAGQRISNRGAVEGVAALAAQRRTRTMQRFVVVTRETTTAGNSSAYLGLAPAWHVTVATVTAIEGRRGWRWVVSGWQPET